ncbi:RNA-directed DNA polymerase, eukaryota, reverse transcriptase zinc-binding domain protein [Tanacetum coccineum]
METLHLSFKRIINVGLYRGISINGSLTLSHLFYADDVVFVGEWKDSNIHILLNVLKCFFLASGLKINLQKSKLMGLGVSSNVVNSAANLMGCSILQLPFNYLGVKVGCNMSYIGSWDDVISKVSTRLSKWKIKSLSIGGRLSLLKSVLTSIPLYHMSIFKVPMGVLKKLESIRRNFFNGHDGFARKSSWFNWNKALASKKNGGIGVSSFFAINRALLFKWVWRFFSDGSSLWSTFIKALFGFHGAIGLIVKPNRRSIWSDILQAVNSLKDKEKFPRLYALEESKSISVADKLGLSSLYLSFRRPPRGGIEQESFNLLCQSVRGLVLSNIEDRWSWSLEGSGLFSVKSSRAYIDDLLLPKADAATRWIRILPIKINVFAWKVCLDALPTRCNMSLRGIDIPSILVVHRTATIAEAKSLPLSIKGNVTSSKPVDLHEAIDMAQGKVLMLASYPTAESVDDTTLTHALLLVTTMERQDIRPKTAELYLALQTKEDPEAKEDRAVMSLVLDVAKKDITRTSVRTMGIKAVGIKFKATRKTLRTIKGKIKETLREVTKHQPVLKEDAGDLAEYTTYVKQYSRCSTVDGAEGAEVFITSASFCSNLGNPSEKPSTTPEDVRDLMANLTPSCPCSPHLTEKGWFKMATNAEQAIQDQELEASQLKSAMRSHSSVIRTQLAFSKREKTDAVKKLLPTVVGRLLQSHEYKQSLSVPFNYALQTGWGQGLAEARSEEELREIMMRMNGFDPYSDKKMNAEYERLFSKTYSYVDRISHLSEKSVQDLLKLHPAPPPKDAPKVGSGGVAFAPKLVRAAEVAGSKDTASREISKSKTGPSLQDPDRASGGSQAPPSKKT